MAELLLEIGTEEIPARMMQKAAQDLKTALGKFLDDSLLSYENLQASCAPRQVVISCDRLDLRQEDRTEWVFGPPVRIAYDKEGQPSKALQGFLRKNPLIDASQLVHKTQPKGDVVAAEVSITGRETKDLLGEALPDMLNRMHFAKNMRWGGLSTRFVRPVRSILAILGEEVIPFEFGGVTAGRTSFGHRVFGNSGFEVSSIAQFHQKKSDNRVINQHAARRETIEAQINGYLETIGGQLVEDEKLLREVADLVECPYVVCGHFDEKFLEIPREVLVTSIREHQKSFCVENPDGTLRPYFLSIASVPHDKKGLVKKGNEWVLNARLWDAKFFWEADLKKDFDQLRLKLKDLMFIQQIGSYYQKSERLGQLCGWMANTLGWSEADTRDVTRAGVLAKADLVSDLVFEFPELQGVTGGLLLKASGASENLWKAVYDHYLPVSMDGELPETHAGALVALADKLDTLVGCFAAGLIPTGSKDPYALRRAAQGVVQILVDKEIPIALSDLLDQAIAAYDQSLSPAADLKQTLESFFEDRLRYFLKLRKFDHALINGVLATDTQRIDQALRRANAVAKQQEKEDFRNLALNLKRIHNILADEKDQLPAFSKDLLKEAVEHDLWHEFQKVKPMIEEAVTKRDYNHAMDVMSGLAEPVDAYFGTSGVYINTDDTALRLNRKSMLNEIRQVLGLVADISCLAPKA